MIRAGFGPGMPGPYTGPLYGRCTPRRIGGRAPRRVGAPRHCRGEACLALAPLGLPLPQQAEGLLTQRVQVRLLRGQSDGLIQVRERRIEGLPLKV